MALLEPLRQPGNCKSRWGVVDDDAMAVEPQRDLAGRILLDNVRRCKAHNFAGTEVASP